MFELAAPSALQWLIGVEIARFRNEAGLTLSQLSDATGIGRPKLGHMETGRSVQYANDIRRVLKACKVPREDIDRLVLLSSRPDEAAWIGPWTDVASDWLRTLVGLESLARKEFVFEPIVLPGLLQTEAYARAMTAGASRVRPDAGERLVEFRMERTRLLTKDPALELHAVINEQALNLWVGDWRLLNQQYEHLLRMSELPNVTIQVLRAQGGLHSATTGQFMLLDFAEARSIVYVEIQDAGIFVDDARRVHTYTLSTESLKRVALSPAESVTLIHSLIT
ncbi:transcriptional regulator with XRE-family HTH domain [Saccharothrix tamanrassetensis]|uniref:Transcriptional regulator with XRE-family HTH domain n=1 Tax=Saccharothrix tamanrassetensis TaxID=1051531 RepID=A0A841CND9_9PSEU|nr:helix-turn-helix transcriptional regulator [Saccharothrix tamanrassetensis]MBB5957495.1 transcriptional regulator with XRE-family HTH domain [Saccharothrix tamanrassetensis]